MNLQNRLRSLSSGLVGLRNCIHDQQNGAPAMEVAISADNGLNRVDSGSSLSPLNGASVAFSTASKRRYTAKRSLSRYNSAEESVADGK